MSAAAKSRASSPAFYRSWGDAPLSESDGTLYVGNYPVMYASEGALMDAFGQAVAAGGGDVLEVGYGLGLCAESIQRRGCRSHTILEPHPEIFRAATRWSATKDARIVIARTTWQDGVGELDRYDAIMFDAYSEPGCEAPDLVAFLETSTRRLLRPGGCVAFFTRFSALTSDEEALCRRVFARYEVRTVPSAGTPAPIVPIGWI